MNKLFLIFLTTFFVSCVTFSPQTYQNIPSQKWNPDTAFASTAKVYFNITKAAGGGSLSGTAFAITDKYLLSAGHVCVAYAELEAKGLIEPEIYLDIYGADGETIITLKDVTIYEINEPDDLCVFKRRNHSLAPVVFASSLPRIHSRVWLVGSPLGLFQSKQEGEFVGIKTLGVRYRNKMIITNAAAGGNSGSPVFDENGCVIGVLIAGATDFDHASICTPLSKIKRFLKLIGVANERR